MKTCEYCGQPMEHFDQGSLGSLDVCQSETCPRHEVGMLMLLVEDGTAKADALAEFVNRSPKHMEAFNAAKQTQAFMTDLVRRAKAAGATAESIREAAARLRREAGLSDG